MKAVVQRVTQASVEIENKTVASIKKGLLILLGIEEADTDEDIRLLSRKITHLRIFNDANNVMNLSVKDVDANAIVVSQFTLYANTKKGNRPSYVKAAKPDIAIPLYRAFIVRLEKDLGKKVQTGQFGAYMQLHFTNDGPVTLIIDTKNP